LEWVDGILKIISDENVYQQREVATHREPSLLSPAGGIFRHRTFLLALPPLRLDSSL